MPRRKKFPRLPSGFGTIRNLGRGRARSYAVHPPAKEINNRGDYVRPQPICYVEDWHTGFAVLSAYHAGTYEPGQELTIHSEVKDAIAHGIDLDMFCRRVISNIGLALPVLEIENAQLPTFREVYEQYYANKYGERAAKKLSKQAARSTRAAFQLLPMLHDRPFASITLEELQAAVNGIQKSRSTISNVITLVKQMYQFAVPRELCSKDYGRYVQMPSTREGKHREAFTDEQLAILWKHADDPIIKMLLVMCYSGFRVSAYLTLETNLEEKYFRGGVKTASGKNRIVPIHSAILPLVEEMGGKYLCGYKADRFRQKMIDKLALFGLDGFTPHCTRHTFSRLCESYKVNEADRKRMMGHSFGNDITNAVYGHRTVEELRAEIEKIKLPEICDHL